MFPSHLLCYRKFCSKTRSSNKKKYDTLQSDFRLFTQYEN